MRKGTLKKSNTKRKKEKQYSNDKGDLYPEISRGDDYANPDVEPGNELSSRMCT